MADFHTTNLEEMLIDRVRKEGFGYSHESELPKYFILRIALARGLRCPKIPLRSQQWEYEKLKGERGKEYRLEQITGKGKDKKEDMDVLLRAFLYIQHKEELEKEESNIFTDEKKYLEILEKYIRRGLYEIQYSWKNKDCFYQWCLDTLGLQSQPLADSIPLQDSNSLLNEEYFTKLQGYFRKLGIGIDHIDTQDSYRHYICKIALQDSTKISAFKKNVRFLGEELGVANVDYQQIDGVPRGYYIAIPKPREHWQTLGKSDYEKGLQELQKKAYELGIFAGYTLEGEILCFDLAKAPHLFVAGTTGSGKTSFLCVMIHTLLDTHTNEELEIIVIDPKHGADYKEFSKNVRLIVDMNETCAVLDSLIEKMENRYTKKAEGEEDFLPIVCFVDELNDLVGQDKEAEAKLERLAQKARAAKIHLILGTQRPDSKVFSGALRSNIPSRIALKVQKSTESKIILDEFGAENLLGTGDMLVKIIDCNQPKYVLGIDSKEIAH